MGDLIGIGLTGLQVHQTALSVTGNNVSNTNTPGYSRQEAVFVDNQSLLTGAGYLGQGASTDTIRRNAENFIIEQVRADTTVFHERDAVLTQAESIDNLLASTTTGLTPAMSAFFQAFQGGADDPTSVPQRQLLLTQTEGLVARFHALDSRLNSQMEAIDVELSASVAAINSLSQGLAELNSSIAIAVGAGQGNMPNNLLDARDEALRELSEYVNVSTFPAGDDGQISVFIGNGQPLVLGSKANEMSVTESPVDSERLEVQMVINGRSQIISNELTGGKIGGLLDFRDNDLTSAINNLGRIAVVMTETINKQHSLGMDLEDNLGGLFFEDLNSAYLTSSRVEASSLNELPQDHVLQVSIIDAGQLTAHDYDLRFEGPSDSDYTIFVSGTSEVAARGTLPGIFPASIEVDGFRLQFDGGTFKVGDRFSITPTKNGAQNIDVSIDRVEAIAFASPIRADANIGNTGNASISLGTMLDIESPLTNATLPIFDTPGQLSPPLEIKFHSETRFSILEVTDAGTRPLSPAMNNLLYNPNVTNTIFTADPGEVKVSALGVNALQVNAPAPSVGPLLNGYGAQNLTILNRDSETGVVDTQTVAVVADSSAKDIAASLQNVQGIQANAYTQVRLDNFTDAVDAAPLGFEINGEVITIPLDSDSIQDDLARLINENTILEGMEIYAVSDGVDVEIHARDGIDIVVSVTGGVGDSVDVSTVDPYAVPGSPVLSTQTVVAGNGVAVGGAIDVNLADGMSLTADVDSVFERAPTRESAYLGFQFEIKGQTAAGDSFRIDYNNGGVSDNRNALAIAELERLGTAQEGVLSYGEAYSQIIEEIGTVTSRARLDADSAKALLIQSENNREAISGVNLDEEAGRLIQFQSAYNASAQVVSVARELFDTLLNAFR